MNFSSASTYDVFVCFSPKDTRNSFVSHLQAAFRRNAISAFADDNRLDSKSGQISDAAMAAIEGSRVSVVVFSENYALSSTCLNGLVKVLECRRNNGQTVIPVFYGISRSFVEHQKGRFKTAFTEHERSAAVAGQVSIWRDALKETAGLPGHESNEDRSDPELVEEIVRDVYDKLFPTANIGINLRLLEIENLLSKQSWGIRSIGIWGMPGIGKTTIAQAACNQMSGDYEASYFLPDFNKAFCKKGLHHLREDYLATILKGEPDIGNFITDESVIREKLCRKRILVVLDDVLNSVDAESVLGGFDWFGPGSLIIITTTDRQVLVQCRVNEIYLARGLDDKEALLLFSRLVFGKDKPENEFQALSMKVIEYANANPRVLNLCGEILKGKKLTKMEEAFLELEQNPLPQIQEVLKSSYDAAIDSGKNVSMAGS